MKKMTAAVLCFVLALSLTGCGNNSSYKIRITIPAGSTDKFSYSDEEISPTGKSIIISSCDGLSDTEVVLKAIEVKEENAYEPAPLPSGAQIKMDTEKGAWFKIGVAVQSETDEDKAVFVEVKGAEIRIAGDSAVVGGNAGPAVCIDGVTYYDTGKAVPAEPDESAVEYVEIPFGGETAGTIKAFVRLEEGKMILCLIDDAWYEFAVK